MACGAGLLVLVAAALPHIAMSVAPGTEGRPGLRVVTATPPPPDFVPAPVIVVPAPVAAVADLPVSGAVYGDAKIADFDPEHPPARMGEPG